MDWSHYGASPESAGSWTSVPFRYITTTAEGASAQMPATTWYGSDSNSANGANGAQGGKVHQTYLISVMLLSFHGV